MKRVLVLLLTQFITLLSFGCCLPSEKEALKPLAPEGRLFTYREMIARARVQAMAAVESFYLDAWTELEQTAGVLEQTARFLPRTTDQPEHLKKVLTVRSSSLRDDAVRLADAARSKNVQAATDALQQIHLTIRTLRAVD
jgi:hypothetical protein